jgi:hypothetical protein
VAEGDDGVLEALEDAVVPLGINRVPPIKEGLVGGADRLDAGGELAGGGGRQVFPGLDGADFGCGFLGFHSGRRGD